MELKVSQIKNPEFIRSLKVLLGAKGLPMLSLWDLKEVHDEIIKQIDKADEMHRKLILEYKPDAEQEKGVLNVKQDEIGEEKYKELAGKIDELFNISFKIPLNSKIKLPDDFVGLTVADLVLLEGLLSNGKKDNNRKPVKPK